ncbi:MAG TPA: protein kinase [Polyangiaceae bacterium]|nr:protein kinase [Polyangiaceae bacterium]
MSDFREFQDGEVVPGTRYRVTRLIGAGGMGRVYEVEHVELGKRFVLKALQRELSRREDLVARLRNEWRALARLEHPNIVNVTDAGTSENGVPFYVMERLEGETLSALLHRQRRLVPQQALAIAAGILDGLHAAHQIGVVHRDVKPPNIFLTAPTKVKVLDFGIAKIKDAKDVITARGLAVGTPRYMSPEQAQGSGVDPRSDIYATGLMLFEMVSGVGPFDDARDHNELLLAHLGRPAPPLSSISVVAPELDAVVAAMLAKDPRERPPSARHIADTLRAMSQRYALYPATEAPTVNVPRTPVSEPPTRVEGRRRAAATTGGGPATRPDGVAAHGRAEGDTTTVQPAFEIATTAHSLPNANVTLRLPDAPGPASAPVPTFHGPDTLIDPLTKAPTGVPAPAQERTEMLLSAPHAPGVTLPLDAGPTRTAVPLAEAPNLTPPPVVPTPSLPPPRPRAGRAFIFGAVAVAALLLVAGVLVLRREQPVPSAAQPSPEPATPAVAAAAAVPAPPPALPVAPTPPLSAPPELAPVAAPSASPAAPGPSAKRVTIKKDSEKSVFLAPSVAAPAPVATPASAPPGRRNAAPSMPGSGL